MNNKNLPELAPYISLLSTYSIAVGALYLWGYWSKFELNILEYVGLLQIVTAAAFPLLSALVGIVGGMIIGTIFTSHHLSPGGGKESTAGQFLNRHSNLLLGAYLIVVLVVAPFFLSSDDRALLVPLLLSPLIAFAIAKSDVLSSIILNLPTRASVIGILTLIFCSAFGYGRNRAVDVVEGRDYFTIDSGSLANLPAKYPCRNVAFKLLGHVGEHLFILLPDASLMIIRADTVPDYVLTHHSTKRFWPPGVKSQ